MKSIVYRASTRGHQNHGWLDARHTFSFANYYDPNRIHFGALRVLNDDVIAGGEGFGTHPHDNMEIVTIPLSGDLAHKDSMGHAEVIRSGEVQVMSAGRGITHSEYNANRDIAVNLFQIWVFPNRHNVEPRYEQRAFDFIDSRNRLSLVVSPDGADGSLWIHQNAWFSIGIFDGERSFSYDIKREGNGVFAMVVEGSFTLGDQLLERRDAVGVWEVDRLNLVAKSDSAKILLIDVPMTF